MRVYVTPKIRIAADIGIIAFPEFLQRMGQSIDTDLLSPEDLAAITEPIRSVEDMENRLKVLPSIFERVVDQFTKLPPEKQKDGETFVNNLYQYYSKLSETYNQVKSLQQKPQQPQQPADPRTQYTDDWGDPVQQQPSPDLFDVQLTPQEQKKIDKTIINPPKPKKPSVQQIQKFDPTLLDPEQLGAPTTPRSPGQAEEPSFAVNPEQVKEKRKNVTDLEGLKAPAKKVEKQVADLINWVKNIPDLNVQNNPAKFKKDTINLTNAILQDIAQLKPTIDSLLEQYAM